MGCGVAREGHYPVECELSCNCVYLLPCYGGSLGRAPGRRHCPAFALAASPAVCVWLWGIVEAWGGDRGCLKVPVGLVRGHGTDPGA